MVAGRDVGDALADGLDHAGALVAEHGRGVAGGVDAGGRVHVGVADAAGDESDERLSGARPGQLELLHDQRPAELLEQRGANPHPIPPRLIDAIVEV